MAVDSTPTSSDICTVEEAEEAFQALHAIPSTTALVQWVEKQAGKLLRAETAILFLLERNDNLENLVGTRGPDKQRVAFPIGQGVAGSVAQDSGYYLCNNPKTDLLFNQQIDGIPGIKVRNMISAAAMVPDEDSEELVGVLQAVNRKSGDFTDDDAYWLQNLATHTALAYQRLKRSEEGWEVARNLAESIASAVDDKHVNTVGHADRVRQVALALGKAMKLTGDELLELEFAALLHDIGRLALSPETFQGEGSKKGYADAGEPLHVILTEAMLRGMRLPPYLRGVAEIALSHHERVDGTGYPAGKKNADLSLPARILAVANAFDMLTSGRGGEAPGKRLKDEEALQVLQDNAGKAYDPAVVNQLIKNKLYKMERRRFPRCELETPTQVTLMGGNGQQPSFETVSTEISEGGVLFYSENRMPDQMLLKLRLDLPSETLEALARVARHLPGPDGKGFKVGAYFLWYGPAQG